VTADSTVGGLIPYKNAQALWAYYLGIFALIPCIGIPAIVYSAQVVGKVQAGDIQGAIEASNKAKMRAWISFGVGLVGGVIYGIIVVIGTIAGG
jgi:hypothetical protein